MLAVRLRDAAEVPVSRGVLRGPRWCKVSHGLFVNSVGADLDLRQRCTALLAVLPTGSVFAELTAAALHGWDLAPVPADFPISVIIPPEEHVRRRGLRSRRRRLEVEEVVDLDGLAVTSPVRTLTDLAESLCLIDLVVASDSAVHRGSCSAQQLQAAGPARRGVVAWQRAVPLMDGRSESPQETLLRLIHVVGGVSVEPQRNCFDAEGRFLGRADLWLVGTNRISEVDGAHHRTAARHGKDLARDKRYARGGLERYGYTSREVQSQAARILRDAELALGVDHDPTRMQRWTEEFRLSLYTPSGVQRLRERWRIPEP